MKTLVVCCTFAGALLALSGCEKQAQEATTKVMTAMVAAELAGAGHQARRSGTLAYEHSVSIELSKELLPARLREIEAACAADQQYGCTVLEVSLSSNDDLPSGSICMRLARGGVDGTIALASKDGKVTARSTHAEDLAQPVADTERQLALLTVHRDRLAELMKSKELKVEQLITVSKELATVQTQIESLTTQRANLRRRIDTDLLTINFSLPLQTYQSEQSPVRDALRSFGSDFRQAVGAVITVLANVLPWLVVLIPSLVLLRLLWRWISRWIARRERRAEVASA